MGLTKKVLKVGKKVLTKELTDEQILNGSIYERIAGRKLNKAGIGVLTAGTFAATTINSVNNNGIPKFQKLGDISVGENLDRLISYDGSGFIKNFNNVTQGNSEIGKDVIKHSFTNINQLGASGDIVFALHNMREG